MVTESSEIEVIYIKPQKEFDEDGQSPVSLYHASRKEKGEEITLREASEKWSNLKFKKKAKFIHESLKIMMETMSSNEASDSVGLTGPTLEEIYKYLRFCNFPQIPPLKSSVYYCIKKDLIEGEIIEFNNVFRKLDAKEKKLWYSRLKYEKKKFSKKVDAWKKTQNDVTLFGLQYMNSKKAFHQDRQKYYSSYKHLTTIRNLHFIEHPKKKCYFNYELPLVNLTPQQIFVSDMVELYPSISDEEINTAFELLNEYEKLCYFERAEQNRSYCISDLLCYIYSMRKDERKIYLGFNRNRFMKLFQEDIFEDEYPSSDYPVFKFHNKCFHDGKGSLVKCKEASDHGNESKNYDSDTIHTLPNGITEDTIDFHSYSVSEEIRKNKLNSNLKDYSIEIGKISEVNGENIKNRTSSESESLNLGKEFPLDASLELREKLSSSSQNIGNTSALNEQEAEVIADRKIFIKKERRKKPSTRNKSMNSLSKLKSPYYYKILGKRKVKRRSILYTSGSRYHGTKKMEKSRVLSSPESRNWKKMFFNMQIIDSSTCSSEELNGMMSWMNPSKVDEFGKISEVNGENIKNRTSSESESLNLGKEFPLDASLEPMEKHSSSSQNIGNTSASKVKMLKEQDAEFSADKKIIVKKERRKKPSTQNKSMNSLSKLKLPHYNKILGKRKVKRRSVLYTSGSRYHGTKKMEKSRVLSSPESRNWKKTSFNMQIIDSSTCSSEELNGMMSWMNPSKGNGPFFLTGNDHSASSLVLNSS